MISHFEQSQKDWLIYENGYHPHKLGMYESLFTVGNGYLCVRGSLEENPKECNRGMFIAGIFDKSEGAVTELVKAPGWIDFSVWINDQKFSVDTCKVLYHKRVLDLRKGILHRITRLKDKKGRIVRLETRRVVFAHQVRGSVMDISITPENFSGKLRLISGLNGDVTNAGYFQEERVKHLNLLRMEKGKDHVYLETETRDNKIKIAMASSTVFNNKTLDHVKVNRIYGEKIAEEIVFHSKQRKTYNFTKWVSVFASREGYERQLKASAIDLVHDMIYEGLALHMKRHIEWREKEWNVCDITIKGDKRSQAGIRFNLYHLLISKPHHDQMISIGAKFLTGEGYKGHAFWDTEIFILPFYIYNFPEEAKNLLMYRYYTLNGAIKNAHAIGYRGAKYAWESAESGIETTPDFGYRSDGSKDKIFTGEEEHHIVSDVVFGIYNYVEVTGDYDFLYKFGAEIIFQTARFWLSRIEKRRGRFEIRKTIGPDEFHEHVDNNAFTNYLVIWHLGYAEQLYKKMKKDAPSQLGTLVKKINLKKEEIDKMRVASKVIYFPYDQKTDLIEQFEGYFTLDDHKVTKLDSHGMPEYPRAVHPSNLKNTQLVKQADVVLLLYLFLDKFSKELKRKNYEYYEPRTMHKSSLSPCIYAIMGLEIGSHKKAYNYFLKTSYIDLHNFNKNTADGIHAAATGGAWMTVVHGFAGMRLRRGSLCFDPWLPKKWQELNYKISWKGGIFSVKITHSHIFIKLIESKKRVMSVIVQGNTVRLIKGKTKKINLIKN